MARMLFPNLAVKDLDRAVGFFTGLGFTFDERFTDDTATAMVVNEQAVVMLLTESKFGEFTTRELADPTKHTVQLSGAMMTLFQKTLKGTLFGSSNPRADIPRMLDLYRNGKLKLDELATHRYKLEEVNQGYDDMRAGRSLRGVITF